MPRRPFKVRGRDAFTPSGSGARLPGAPAPKVVKDQAVKLVKGWRSVKARKPSRADPRRVVQYPRKVL